MRARRFLRSVLVFSVVGVLVGVLIGAPLGCSSTRRGAGVGAELGAGTAEGFDPFTARDVLRSGRVPQPASPVVVNPEEAWKWRRLAWLDENGEIAPGAYERALQQREANVAFWAGQGEWGGGGGERDGGISPASWVERGPTNVGGRTRSLLIHPTQPNRLWAGSVSGGIWYSSDSGATWAPVDDQLQNLAIGCLAFDPRNPSIMYAGTGEGYFNGDAIRGLGIYRSIDGGATWVLIPSTAGWENTCRIAVSPVDSSVMLVSRRNGGIFRTTNGGASWTNVLPALGSFQVMFDPTDASRAVGHVTDDGGSGRYHKAVYSVNGGQTWSDAAGLSNVGGFNSRIELAMAPSSPNIVYANTGAGDGQVWRSTDGGQTYTLRTTSGGTGAGWYYNSIWVDPTNPEFLLVGGYRVQKSTNGGQTFSVIADGYIITQTPHPDVHYFAHEAGFNGTTNRRVYVCTDGGVHRTENIYTAADNFGWVSLQPTYVATQFYGAAGHSQSGRIVGGTQDNGTLRVTTSSSTAALTFGGDGGFCAIDWTNPNYTYGEYIYLQIHRSTNGGASAGYIYQGLGDAGSAANFIAPFILDPNNPAVLLAGGRSLWRTSNARAGTVVWSQISAPFNSNISAIAVAPGNSNVIWLALNNGRVYRTNNGIVQNPTWIAVDDNGGLNPLPNRYPNRIVIDRDNPSVVYIAFGGFSANNLQRTTDSGATWTDITGAGETGLPDAPIRGLARHPSDPQRLYAGTEVGIFATGNGGVTWSANNQGPASVSVDELTFMHGSATLLAATHGRGMWTAPVLTCTADWDGEGGVNSGDISAFLTVWLASVGGGTLDADFNGDLAVNSIDISAFLTAWLGQVGLGC